MAPNVRFSNPKTLAKPPGYSYVVEATGPNRLIFIAGQLGLDMENKLVGAPGDFRAQAEKAIENLKLALADAGATLKEVVKINNYLVDMSPSRSWHGLAPCSRSRLSRCCRQELGKRQRPLRDEAGERSRHGVAAGERQRRGRVKANASALHPNCRPHAHRPVAAHAIRRQDRERSASRS